ncbi:MAG: helix-turn-helix transcriptional regulator [Alphaproteobacteria bacterium]|nr:helix-turn-helix transcriptional regulator [Alphaproteobacteria bacterium]
MTEPDTALDGFLRLIGERGFESVALQDVADAAGLSVAELRRRHPDKAALALAFMAKIDAAVAAGAPTTGDPDETVRDRLFDTMMRRYDALSPHRAALRALHRAAQRDPFLALRLASGLRRSMAATLEAAGASSAGILGIVRQNALLAIHYAVSQVFDRDESADLSKTMAALDGHLKTVERWAQAIEKYDISVKRRVRNRTGP